MSSGLSLVVSPCCVNFAWSDDLSHQLYTRPCTSPLCRRGSTTASQQPYSVVFSPYSTSLLSRSPAFVASLSTSQTLLPASTGHVHPSESSLSWRTSSHRLYRAVHGTAPRYLSDLLRRVADMPWRGCLRSSSTSRLDVRPSRRVTVGTGHLLLLVPGSGTVSLGTSPRLLRRQSSFVNWRLTCFDSLAQTLHHSVVVPRSFFFT